MKNLFFCLTPENAEEFFKRCIEREAVTMKERLAILKELSDEQKLLLAGELESKAGKALSEYFEAKKHKGIIMLKEKEHEPVREDF